MEWKFLVIGDPHFKISNVADTILMVNEILAIAKKYPFVIIVVLGDVLDLHESIHAVPLKQATLFLRECSLIAKTIVLIGNHDLKNNRQFLSDDHPFTALKFWDNIVIVDAVHTEYINDKKFTFVPYVSTGRFVEALDTSPVGWKDSHCIFAHQEFKGAKMGVIISQEGDTWDPSYPRVISGHIHDYQEIDGIILYIGTPIQHGYSDTMRKTISIIDFDPLLVSPGQVYTEERITLNVPKKRIIHLGCIDVSSYETKDNGDRLKIIIKGSTGDMKAIRKHPNIDIWRAKNYKIVFKDTSRWDPTASSYYQENQSGDIKPVKYSVLLKNKINGDKKLCDAYDSMYGSG